MEATVQGERPCTSRAQARPALDVGLVSRRTVAVRCNIEHNRTYVLVLGKDRYVNSQKLGDTRTALLHV